MILEILKFLGILLAIAVTSSITIAALTTFFFNSCYTPHVLKTSANIEELYDTINIIVQNEIAIYERSVFLNRGKMLNNATFERYYTDICKHIDDDLPREFFERHSHIMRADAIRIYITELVQLYLSQKIVE